MKCLGVKWSVIRKINACVESFHFEAILFWHESAGVIYITTTLASSYWWIAGMIIYCFQSMQPCPCITDFAVAVLLRRRLAALVSNTVSFLVTAPAGLLPCAGPKWTKNRASSCWSCRSCFPLILSVRKVGAAAMRRPELLLPPLPGATAVAARSCCPLPR
jgi:hypothetical protein